VTRRDEPEELTLEKWEAMNRQALTPALQFLYAQFVNIRDGMLPWDNDDSHRRAALDAIRAIEWLLQPVQREVVKLYKEPYYRDDKKDEPQ
jgi:hypothetical protein